MAVVKRGKILRGDLANWDGRSATSTRTDATGGTLTGLSVGNEVDVLQVFGSGTSRTEGSLAGAVRYIGTDTVTLVLAPGTWTIAASVTLPSNFIVRVVAGCILNIANGVTLTISGYVQAGDYQIFSGTGTVAIGFGEVFPEWWGAAGDGVANDTTAVQSAISTGRSVILKRSAYLVNNLTQSTDFQQITATGRCHLHKNANGPVLTSTGDSVVFRNIDFRDDNDAYTGDGLVCSGEQVRVVECGGYRIAGVALKITGGACQVFGTCNIYHTRTSGGYDIEIGVSGTATLYHRLYGIYTSQSGGGIKFIDCGGHSVVGSQFGKLTIEDGTSPTGVNGGTYSNNRILGNVEVEISSSTFVANAFGAINVHFVAGTSGHRLDDSNVFGSGATFDDDSNESYVVDTSLIPELQAYTPTWTAASVNPTLGNGTITAYYTLHGRRAFFTMELVFGTTTNPGTGNWSFTLPIAPAVKQIGVAQAVEDGVNTEGGIVAFAGGSASFQVFPSEAPSNAMGSTVPFTWGTADRLCVTGEYYVA